MMWIPGYPPHPSLSVKVLLGAGFEKKRPQNPPFKGLRGKIRRTKDLGAGLWGSSRSIFFSHDRLILRRGQGWMSHGAMENF
jgi:hypothetical protein